MDKKLYRSESDTYIAGVAGGLAKYFQVDSTLIRVLFVAGAFMEGFGILVYLILALIVPIEPRTTTATETHDSKDPSTPATNPTPTNATANQERQDNSKLIIGGGLLLLGLFFLAKTLMPTFYLERFWPLLLIGGGLFLLYRSIQK